MIIFTMVVVVFLHAYVIMNKYFVNKLEIKKMNI